MSAERHANTDFTGAPRDIEGESAIQPNAG